MAPAPSMLRSRPPTGKPAIPMITVHGPSKSGRTVATIKLRSAPWVDRMFVAQIGTQAWDDYGAYYPGVEILDHDGTTSSVLAQIEAACAVKAADGKLNVIVVDDATEYWDAHKILAEHRQRRNKNTKAALANDPDAEVDPTMDKWNDVKARWARAFTLMKRADVIGVWVCRADDVSKVDGNGNPVQGQREYRIEAEKSTASRSTMMVRVYPDHRVVLESVTSLKPDLLALVGKRGGYTLPDDNPLAHAVELVRTNEGWGTGQGLVTGEGATTTTVAAKTWMLDMIRAMVPTLQGDDAKADLRQVAAAIWSQLWTDRPVPGDELTEVMVEHMKSATPGIIIATLVPPEDGPPAVPEIEIDDTEPDQVVAVVPDPKVPTVCAECGKPHHYGPCSAPVVGVYETVLARWMNLPGAVANQYASSLVSLGLASREGEMLGPFDAEYQSQFVQVVKMAEEAAAAAAPKEEASG